MRKIWARLVYRFIIFTYAAAIGLALAPAYKYRIKDVSLIRRSYISDIKGDLFNSSLAKKHLDKFNEYGHNSIVKYEPNAVAGIPRPIVIEIRKLDQNFYEKFNENRMLAYATPLEEKCTIVIRDDLRTEIQFRDTLIHELLHCFEYLHNERDDKDLMYPEDNSENKLPSIIKYAKEIEERIK